MWSDYVYLFEKVLKQYPYWAVSGMEKNDPVFNSYVLKRDERFQYVHFLYYKDRRYKIIRRKMQREHEGKSVEHLKRHQRDRISDERMAVRLDDLRRCFESLSRYQAGR
jgi:hypothetical protein